MQTFYFHLVNIWMQNFKFMRLILETGNEDCLYEKAGLKGNINFTCSLFTNNG